MERRSWAAAVLVVPFLAGCFGVAPGTNGDPESVGVGQGLQPDCSATGSEALEDGVCVQFLARGGAGLEFEPHVAAHPTDPGTVLVAAMHMGDENLVWVALTRDAGATWAQEDLAVGGALPEDLPNSGTYAFDPVTAFGPDGTAYVLFEGQNEHVGPIDTVTRISLARLPASGGQWSIHTVDERPGPTQYQDYADLAVAPDTGDLYVAGDVHLVYTRQPVKPVLFWRSTDGGLAWEEPIELAPAATASRAHFARVAAGLGGLVVVTAITETYSPADDRYVCLGQVAWISRDGGASFEPPAALPGFEDSCLRGMQPAVWNDGRGSARIDVAFETDAILGALRSHDAGRTWAAAFAIAEVAPDTRTRVFEATAARDGTFLVLERSDRLQAERPRFIAALLAVPPDATAARRLVLVDSGDGDIFNGGGHYGGLAEATDGTVWAAWGDPRGSAQDRIAVVQLARVPDEPHG